MTKPALSKGENLPRNATAVVANVLSDMSEGELEARVAVAACYRLLVHYRLSDLRNGFVAARIPDEPAACLVGRYGDFPEEVTARSLVRMSIHNTTNVVAGHDVARAAVPLFQSLFHARRDVYCVIHTHTKSTEVLSSLGCELLPMSHPALMLHKRTEYVDYAFFHDEEFCKEMVEAFKGNVCLIMRNHGMMAVGRTPAATFFNTFNLDQACAIQLAAYHAGREICLPQDTDGICELYVSEVESEYGSDGSLQWAGWLRTVPARPSPFTSTSRFAAPSRGRGPAGENCVAPRRSPDRRQLPRHARPKRLPGTPPSAPLPHRSGRDVQPLPHGLSSAGKNSRRLRVGAPSPVLSSIGPVYGPAGTTLSSGGEP